MCAIVQYRTTKNQVDNTTNNVNKPTLVNPYNVRRSKCNHRGWQVSGRLTNMRKELINTNGVDARACVSIHTTNNNIDNLWRPVSAPIASSIYELLFQFRLQCNVLQTVQQQLTRWEWYKQVVKSLIIACLLATSGTISKGVCWRICTYLLPLY